jgi:phosphate transport system substrate-binding protein
VTARAVAVLVAAATPAAPARAVAALAAAAAPAAPARAVAALAAAAAPAAPARAVAALAAAAALAAPARAVAALAAAAALAVPAGAPAATVDVSGSTTALPLVADLAWFYRHDVERPGRFTLVGGGTSAGIADAARGIVDIGLASRARSPNDPPGLRFTAFAASAVCLVTNVANPLPALSRAQLQELVSARATSWAQVAGSARTDAIATAALTEGTGARSIFESVFVDAETPIADTAREFVTAAQVRDHVRALPAAWGYVDFAFTRGLHVVPFDGVACDRATIASGAYPGRRDLAFVTRGAPRGAAARFIRWVRSSRVARRVIATRYVPLGR